MDNKSFRFLDQWDWGIGLRVIGSQIKEIIHDRPKKTLKKRTKINQIYKIFELLEIVYASLGN